MKYKLAIYLIGIFLIISQLLSGCNNSNNSTNPSNLIELDHGKYSISTIDSCEYITWNYSYAGNIIHKQNCKYCLQRSNSKK